MGRDPRSRRSQRTACSEIRPKPTRDHELIVKETTFEFLPLHAVAEINPIPPETKVVPPSGGLNTKTSTVPGCAMSVAVTVATNRRLLVNVVTRNELSNSPRSQGGSHCRLGGFSLTSGFNHFTVSTHA